MDGPVTGDTSGVGVPRTMVACVTRARLGVDGRVGVSDGPPSGVKVGPAVAKTIGPAVEVGGTGGRGGASQAASEMVSRQTPEATTWISELLRDPLSGDKVRKGMMRWLVR